jgi:hypothetical protein
LNATSQGSLERRLFRPCCHRIGIGIQGRKKNGSRCKHLWSRNVVAAVIN